MWVNQRYEVWESAETALSKLKECYKWLNDYFTRKYDYRLLKKIKANKRVQKIGSNTL